MELDKKSQVYAVTRNYLEIHSPEQIGEFKLTFDPVYRTAEKQSREDNGSDELPGNDWGSSFDTSATNVGTVATVIRRVAVLLVRAVIRLRSWERFAQLRQWFVEHRVEEIEMITELGSGVE